MRSGRMAPAYHGPSRENIFLLHPDPNVMFCVVYPNRAPFFFFFQAEDGIRDLTVTGVQTWLFRSGPYEHHSNELPWRESIADVIVIGEDADGRIDLERLRRALDETDGRPLRIGSFSAASN